MPARNGSSSSADGRRRARRALAGDGRYEVGVLGDDELVVATVSLCGLGHLVGDGVEAGPIGCNAAGFGEGFTLVGQVLQTLLADDRCELAILKRFGPLGHNRPIRHEQTVDQ